MPFLKIRSALSSWKNKLLFMPGKIKKLEPINIRKKKIVHMIKMIAFVLLLIIVLRAIKYIQHSWVYISLWLIAVGIIFKISNYYLTTPKYRYSIKQESFFNKTLSSMLYLMMSILFMFAMYQLINILLPSTYFFDKIYPSLIGTGIGALLVFQINRFKENSDEIKRYQAASNHAIFALKQQFENLLLIETELSRWRSESLVDERLVKMRPYLNFVALPSLNFENLNWLLETDHRNILGELTVAHNRYLTVLGIIELRKQIISRVDDHLEKVIENQEFKDGIVPYQFILDHLTDRQITELNQSCEYILEHNLSAIYFHYDIIEQFNAILKEIWPDDIFIKLEPMKDILRRISLDLAPNPDKLNIHRIEIN